MPILPVFAGRCSPEPGVASTLVESELPHSATGELLRPAVVWFGESLDPAVMRRCSDAIRDCDLLLVCGTSSTVYPAAAFAPTVKSMGRTVVEVNLESTGNSALCDLTFQGQCGELLPSLLGVEDDVRVMMREFSAARAGRDGGAAVEGAAPAAPLAS